MTSTYGTQDPAPSDYAADEALPASIDAAVDAVDAAAETPPAANVPLTDDDEVIDGEVTLPGSYADCREAGGREFTVHITNRERVLWERTARKREWGLAEDSPHEALTFMAWSGARRDGDPAGSYTFDEFVDKVVDVEGRRVARVRPTR